MTNKKKINLQSKLILSIKTPIPYKKTMTALKGGQMFTCSFGLGCSPALPDSQI